MKKLLLLCLITAVPSFAVELDLPPFETPRKIKPADKPLTGPKLELASLSEDSTFIRVFCTSEGETKIIYDSLNKNFTRSKVPFRMNINGTMIIAEFNTRIYYFDLPPYTPKVLESVQGRNRMHKMISELTGAVSIILRRPMEERGMITERIYYASPSGKTLRKHNFKFEQELDTARKLSDKLSELKIINAVVCYPASFIAEEEGEKIGLFYLYDKELRFEDNKDRTLRDLLRGRNELILPDLSEGNAYDIPPYVYYFPASPDGDKK